MTVNAVVITSELQNVDGRSNKHYLGHVVDVGGNVHYAVFQWGTRDGTSTFQVHRHGLARQAHDTVGTKLRDKRRYGYHIVESALRFTVTLPSPAVTAADPVTQLIAGAYQNARREKYRTLIDAITTTRSEDPGPWSAVVLPGFTRNARSEPVPQAISAVLNTIPSAVKRGGDVAVLLPAHIVGQLSRHCLGLIEVRCADTPDRTSRAVLETAMSLWEPGSNAELATFGAAYTTAALLVSGS